jgi:hypothetical protein
MVDTPTDTGVQTAYIGNLTLHGNQARSRPRARAASAPASGGCVAGG